MTKKYEKFTYEYFVRRAKEVHGNKYDYANTIVKSYKDKVKIFCNKHQEYFFQRPYGHLEGKGCQKCANENRNNSRKYTTQSFIQKANIVHHDTYDYSETEYVNSKTKVVIICKKHGKFLQTPAMHLEGKGCLKCSIEKLHSNQKLPFKIFLERAKLLFGNKYFYFSSTYDGFHKSIKIYCKTCKKVFTKKVSKHLCGQGCPYCNKSISLGEQRIMNWLNINRIAFDFQKRFKKCKHKTILRFDFYLPSYNMCIEYQGRQHYEPVELFDKEESLHDRQERDKIKREFCKKENIKFLEIKYNEPVEQILQVNCQAEN